MHVSPLPSVPPRSRAPTRAGRTLSFYSSAFHRGTALRFRVRSEVNAALIPTDRESGQRKKKPTAVRSHLNSSAKRQRSAAGRCFALSLTAGAPPHIRARGRYSRSIISLRNRAASGAPTDLDASPTRSVWRFHVPRIWNRSINGYKYPVKRKTQNVVVFFVLCLFVVVLFLLNRFPFNTFRVVASHATLLLSVST